MLVSLFLSPENFSFLIPGSQFFLSSAAHYYFRISPLPWTHFQLRIFLTRHIADVRFLKFHRREKQEERKLTKKKNDVLIEAVRDMKMDLGSAFPKPQHFSLDPKFSRIFPPHNHVYSNCSIWHLLSWLINDASPKNDPVG